MDHITKAVLLDSMGSDLTVANAARASFNKTKDEFDAKDAKLISYLADHEHTSPFRHCFASFRCRAPIFVARQLAKHQVGLCLSGDAEITFVKVVNGTSNGTRKVKLRDLYSRWSGQASKYHHGESGKYQVRRGNLRVLNTETGVFETGHIADVTYSGAKPVFRVTLADGKTLKMTKDHRVYTDSGWLPLKDAIGLDVSANGTATMSRECLIGVNGTQSRAEPVWKDENWVAARRAEGLSVDGIAEAAGCSYHNIRKWLAKHGLQFSSSERMAHVTPWNKGKSGYRVSRIMTDAEKDVIRKARSGERSNFWRGGITPDRTKINHWLGGVSAQVHASFGWTCQYCGEVGGQLTAHHVIPVSADPSKAYVIDNLASVHADCHRKIHATPETEVAFAERMRSRGAVVAEFQPKGRDRVGNPLRVHFVKVVGIECAGTEDTYDIAVDHPSHNFVANGMVVHNSWNETSLRYVKAGDVWAPNVWREQSEDKKQGSGGPIEHQVNASVAYDRAIKLAIGTYEELLELGVCREQARAVLPTGVMTEWVWSGSLQAFAHVVRLRCAPDAQAETRELAEQIKTALMGLWPVAMAALGAAR